MDIGEIQHALMHTAYIYGDTGKLNLEGSVNLENAIVNLTCGSVSIGHRTFCGHGVKILTGSHDLDSPFWHRSPPGRDIKIGRFVWLCSGCIILGPCEIGDRCVIAAGAVVTPRTKCESGWIYAGVPAKKLRPAIEVRANAGTGPLLLTYRPER